MPRQVKLEPHLGTDELEQAYRTAKDGVARSQRQILWLVSSGRGTREVAAITGYCVDWIRQLVRRYNAQGSAGVGDQRHHNPGQKRLLNSAQEAELRQCMEQAQADGQGWNSVQVAEWMSTQVGYRVRPERGRDVLPRLGLSTKTPRPRHVKADAEQQDTFKKKLSGGGSHPSADQRADPG
jgi:transposase